MSIAGVRSTLGDQFQNVIALNWLVEMLLEDNIEYVQAESTGLIAEDSSVVVDDIVIKYQDCDKSHQFVQAKIHAPRCENWTIKRLSDELRKAKQQMISHPSGYVTFCSESPFGEFHRLIKSCYMYPDISAMKNSGEKEPLELLQSFSHELACDEEAAFELLKRISVDNRTAESWQEDTKQKLNRFITNDVNALPVLKEALVDLSTKQNGLFQLNRVDLTQILNDHGCFVKPPIAEAEAVQAFQAASSSTSSWPRAINGKNIPRIEVRQLKDIVSSSASALVLGQPGCGKTCVLMTLVDDLLSSDEYAVLFIRGDEYEGDSIREQLHQYGLHGEIESVCSMLTSTHRVAVIIDSLDVLSLAGHRGPLKEVIGILDRLERIEGVSVIVACREFDWKYNHLLSRRQWEKIVTCAPLDANLVKELLLEWGIYETPHVVLDLLRLPVNLKRYFELRSRGVTFRGATESSLIEAWLDDSLLRCRDKASAKESLKKMVNLLLQRRRSSIPKELLSFDDQALQTLQSAEVVSITSRGEAGLGHQTLRDTIHAQALITQGTSLKQFCADNLQHPFIRSTLRTLFFLYAERDEKQLRQQIRDIISDEDTAFHFKRLICESLGELEPTSVGRRLFNYLFETDKDLFRFFIYSLKSEDWFMFLGEHFIPALCNGEWLVRYVDITGRWIGQIPSQVLGNWIKLFDLYPNLLRDAFFQIRKGLQEISSGWDCPELSILFERLLQNVGDIDVGLHLLGTVSRWVEATDGGDDLLWRYMTTKVDEGVKFTYQLSNVIRCGNRYGIKDGFLASRLFESDVLFDLVLKFLISWSEGRKYSWEGRYSSHFLECLPHIDDEGDSRKDDIDILCESLLKAMLRHAKENASWWTRNEPILRTSEEEGLLCMLLLAYLDNVHNNYSGIENFLTNMHFLRYSGLHYEIGQLLNKATPYLRDDVVARCQEIIHSLYREEGEPDDAMMRICLRYLLCIPASRRTVETSMFIAKYAAFLEVRRPGPRKRVSASWVAPPVSCSDLENLSNKTIVSLLLHFSSKGDWHQTTDGNFSGGREELITVFMHAVSNDPVRFLSLWGVLKKEGVHRSYREALLGACADHIAIRNGTLTRNDKNWMPFEPLPDMEWIAGMMLHCSTCFCKGDSGRYYICNAYSVCSQMLTSIVDRVILLDRVEKLWIIEKQNVREFNENQGSIDAKDFLVDAMCNLYIAFFRDGYIIPDKLTRLLLDCACENDFNSRRYLLRYVPYFINITPDNGWEMLKSILSDAPGEMFSIAEKCFYYNYKSNFNSVKFYLDQIFRRYMETAAGTWGRIMALASLEGHVRGEDLFSGLEGLPVEASKGIASVFARNIAHDDSHQECIDGIRRLLQTSNASNLCDDLERMFSQDYSKLLIPDDIAISYIQQLPDNDNYYADLYFLPWLANRSFKYPCSALAILEILAEKIACWNVRDVTHTEYILSALSEILSDAEESADDVYLRRALKLFDNLQKLNIIDFDSFIHLLGQN